MNIKGALEADYKTVHLLEKNDHPTLDQLVTTSAQVLCEEIMSQIEVAEKQAECLRNRYMRVQFEDIAHDASNEMKKLYGHYGLKSSEKLMKWIKINTKGRTADGETYETLRKSVDVPSKWEKILKSECDKQLVKIVEEQCSKMMQKLGYVPQFKNFTNSPV
jgi:hypothetical protein